MVVPIVAGVILAGLVGVFVFWGGIVVGDKVWPWERYDNDSDEDNPGPYEIPLPGAGAAGLGLIALAAIAYIALKGRG